MAKSRDLRVRGFRFAVRIVLLCRTQLVADPIMRRLGYQLLPLMNIISLLTGRSFQPNQLARYEGVIPVEMFDKNWRSGEIGRLIKQYAPQAYENATE